MRVLFTDCWVGCYVGEGEYEGGTCPDILITNVPENEDVEDLFDKYLDVLCGTSCHDQKEYEVSYYSKRGKKPLKLTNRDDLVGCCEEYVEVDYNDLLDWYFNEVDDEEN
jgi:hypothetical protein